MWALSFVESPLCTSHDSRTLISTGSWNIQNRPLRWALLLLPYYKPHKPTVGWRENKLINLLKASRARRGGNEGFTTGFWSLLMSLLKYMILTRVPCWDHPWTSQMANSAQYSVLDVGVILVATSWNGRAETLHWSISIVSCRAKARLG